MTSVSATASTPQRLGGATNVTPSTRRKDVDFQTPSSSSHPPSYRPLYRGSLSLPDSHLLLDGLTFSARLESPTKHQLLDNPLALALESMRGRQSLGFLGTVKLSDVWLDESGNIEMDIHPRATLSKIYFENIFCLLPYPPASTSRPTSDLPSGFRSEFGVKIALGDTDGPETTHIVVFGQVNTSNTRVTKLRVARITPHPPQKPAPSRVPRPDDPIPRRLPILSRTKSIGTGSLTRDLKRTASSSSSALALMSLPGDGGIVTKRQKLTNGNTKELPKSSDTVDKVFKVPPLPGKVKGKAKEKERDKEDVFGSTLKRKASFTNELGKGSGPEETEVERANKNLIKKASLEHLCRAKDPTLQRTVDRTHPEFKEIWGWVYRGVGFALRAHMKTTLLDKQQIQHLIETHTNMYISESPDHMVTGRHP